MRKSTALLLTMSTIGALALSIQAQAQSQSKPNVQLKDLGVPATQSNPNVINEPITPKPSPVPTMRQQLDNQYQESQSKPGPTLMAKPQTSPGERSIGVGVSVPIKDSGVSPGPAKVSRQ